MKMLLLLILIVLIIGVVWRLMSRNKETEEPPVSATPTVPPSAPLPDPVESVAEPEAVVGGSHAAVVTPATAPEPATSPTFDLAPETPADPASSAYDSPDAVDLAADETPAATTGSETVAFDAAPTSPPPAGSAPASADGSGPEGWIVKAREGSIYYQTPDSPSYHTTVAGTWFDSEESAQSAGLKRWDNPH